MWISALLTPMLLAAQGAASVQPQPGQPAARLRVIVTTDGEIDDRCSMIRFLLYTNEWDVRGIVLSSSRYHWRGNAQVKAHNWEGEEWIQKQLDAYAAVYPNLVKHDPGFPRPDVLRARTAVGNVETMGDMERPTPGSQLIVKELLDADTGPLWIQAWGGPNTIARALKTIEEEHPEKRAHVERKARLFLIEQQDDTYANYIAVKWPKILTIESRSFPAIAYDWRKIMSPEEQRYFDGEWMRRNILRDHGPLCAMYEAHRDGAFISEGDSPAFLHTIERGLGAPLNPGYGGWGGRFQWNGKYWESAKDDGDFFKSILRWAADFQNDWAVRADWCVLPPEKVNHPPQVVCNGDRSLSPVRIRAKPGEQIRLSAAGTKDPDGDALSYSWIVYREAGDYWGAPAIEGGSTPSARMRVPEDASGRSIHVILRVVDAGEPNLAAYRRVIVEVSGEPGPVPPDAGLDTAYLNTPITRLAPPPAETGPWLFHRAVNINGPAVTIDGNAWEAENAANFECSDTPLAVPDLRLRPPTDADRARMIQSFRWSTSAKARLTSLPPGRYAVFVYIVEDNNPETLNISLNGRGVASRYVSGVQGEWRRLGPWYVDVSEGVIELTSGGGAANLCGIEVWRRQEAPR
jgi:hypothetical protein